MLRDVRTEAVDAIGTTIDLAPIHFVGMLSWESYLSSGSESSSFSGYLPLALHEAASTAVSIACLLIGLKATAQTAEKVLSWTLVQSTATVSMSVS